jgi:threonine dehydrogenase-like Zn-dependent dehydrogenase
MQQRAIAAGVGASQPMFVTVPTPDAPAAGEVLCRTLELGICGTDREILLSEHPALPFGESFLVLGHECLARVEAVGTGVNELRAGQLVVPTVRRRLGASPLRIDMLAPGSYTERGIVEHHGFSQPLWLDAPEYLLPVSEALADVAVFAEPLAVAEKGINEALAVQRGRLGDEAWRDPPPRVLVTGLGPIAFAALIAAVARGWPTTVLGRDRENSYRAQLAQRLGAKYATLGRIDLSPDDVERRGYDLLLECTGSDELLLDACGTLAARAVAVWLGSSRTPSPTTLNVAKLMRNGLVRNHLHLGSVNAAPRDFADALAHLAQFQERQPKDLAALFTTRVTPDSSLPHFTARAPQGIKVVVAYD